MAENRSSEQHGRSAVDGSGVSLGRLFGIEIRLDFSVIIIFTLIVWSLGAGVFPQWHPDWPAGMVWSTALAAGILFFLSLLAHELSHSLTARRFGIQVPRITLFLFGGVAEVESEGETPGQEFTIAIMGPLMSLAIGAACMITVTALVGEASVEAVASDPKHLQALGPLATALLWLGSVNFMLAIFNMVPGFPLDGGRVARALVWRLTGDRMRATRAAATGGRVFGWLIMGLGLWELLAYQSLGGLWLILIGWFLSHLAAQSYSQALAQKVLSPLTVGDIMRTHFERVDADMTVADFVDECLLKSNQIVWPVRRDGIDVGVVSLNDILRLSAEDRRRLRVGEVARRLETGSALDMRTPATDALRQLAGLPDEAVPVVGDGQVVGLLRQADIVKWLMVRGGEEALTP